MNHMTSQITRLHRVYSLFENVIKEYTFLCREKCAACCTCNVTMTGLEAKLILRGLDDSDRKSLRERILTGFPQKRFIPKISTNQLARLCVQGEPVPEETNDPHWGSCPLLINNLCTIYAVRPFGCRALMSETDCRKNREAQLPAVLLTICNLFLQFIEHLDEKGVSGNLSDILSWSLAGDNSDKRVLESPAVKNTHLPTNEPVTAWMIPPEHRRIIEPIFMELQRILKN